LRGEKFRVAGKARQIVKKEFTRVNLRKGKCTTLKAREKKKKHYTKELLAASVKSVEIMEKRTNRWRILVATV